MSIATIPRVVGQNSQAYHQLRRLVLLQKIPPGQRLREVDWADRLGVNRSALREAFARLEAEGLVEQGPRAGYRVPQLDGHDIADALEVRILLETGAVERICQKELNSPDHLQCLTDSCDHLELMVADGYVLGAIEADRRFHEGLVRACRNRRLLLIYSRAPLPLVVPEILDHDAWASATREILVEHRQVLAAMLDNEPNLAVRLLAEHLAAHALPPFCEP